MQHHKQVKRFVAPTMTRALDLVREEMGPEAVILSSQRVAEGVEIITSLEPDLPTRGIDVRREFGRHFDAELDTAFSSDSAWKTQAGAERVAADYGGHAEINNASQGRPLKGEELAREIERARERMLAAKRQAKTQQEQVSAPVENRSRPRYEPQPQPVEQRYTQQRVEENYVPPKMEVEHIQSETRFQQQPQEPQYQSHQPQQQRQHFDEDEKLRNLQAELADMRMLLEQQLWRMSENSGLNSNAHSIPQQVQLPPSFSLLNQHLARLGLPEAVTQQLMQTTGRHTRVSDAWRECMAKLAKQIPVTSKNLVNNGGIYAFVGPTGVGKTTTIAKLAARYVLEHGPGKVALITTDTYRVGAYDQLRSLGRILNVPVRAVDGEHTLLTLIASLRNFPLILIDTAGFRHGDPLLQDQLAKLDSCQAIKRILVMSSNSQLQSLTASTHAYSSRQGIDACVLTKVDETASLGEAMGVILNKQIPVAYISNGQEIPKDIAPATGHSIVASAVALLRPTSESAVSVAGGSP